ncbi:cellulase family glycosylhydrolase [Elioraea rosea]|uniref:cellulase family glycosylhydrolase n=1 Tax=Elioraea rosea TaxID=2492390 RepID=UPI0013152E5D|nr:cellulase family glycosylhydrolase [Elioraea rosea]
MIRPEDGYRPGAVPETLLSSLGQGINLQGWTLWSEPVLSLAEMQRLKDDGFDHVRIYFDARATDGNLADYPAELERDWLIAKADATIANALAAGLGVVVAPTSTIRAEDVPEMTEAHVAAIGAYAAHVTAKFGTERIVIETTNEPSFPSQAEWSALEARLIAAIREASPDMTIMTAANLISGGSWSQQGGLQDSVAYRDDNLLYSVHTYFPTVFTNQTAGVSHWPSSPELVGSSPGGVVGWYYGDSVSSGAALKSTIDAFARVADARGMTLHIGEFGVLASAPEASRLAYFAAVTEGFERHGLGWTAWQTHGLYGLYERTESGLSPIDPALREALGIAGSRGDDPLTLTFAAGSTQDLWRAWTGAAFEPAAGTSRTLGTAELGAAATQGASVSVLHDASGGLTVRNLGAWLSVRNVGVEDDGAGRVTLRGFERAWVDLGKGGASTVAVEAMHHRIMTGDGADGITVTAFSPVTANVGGTGYISSGAGDDVITLGVARTAANMGLVSASYEVWAGAGNDRIVIGGGLNGLFSGGSGDDWIVSGTGNEDLRGDVGIDTVELPGPRSAWSFALKEDSAGRYLEAVGPGGTDKLRGFEHVLFGDGTVARFGELWGDRAPEGVTVSTEALAPGEVARARAVDPEGRPLTFFLSDTTGGRFAIDPYSGIVTLRPGAPVHVGESHRIGLGVVDEAGNITGAMLRVVVPDGLAAPTPGTPAASVVTFSNGRAADGFSQVRTPGWTGEVAAGSDVTLTGAALSLPGTPSGARVSLSADAAGATSIVLASDWNGLKNVFVRDPDGGRLVVANFVSVDVEATGGAPLSLGVTDAKRGTIRTGAGDDVIWIDAVANSADGARFSIDTGVGDDRITLTSASAWTSAVIDAGAGDDVIASGPGNDVIIGGAGIDTVQLSGLHGETRFTAGSDASGRFIRAVGPDGTDILSGVEHVVFADGARHRASELAGIAATAAIAIGAGGGPGVLGIARAEGATETTGFTWALAEAASSPFVIDATTGAISLKPGTTLPDEAVLPLDLVVTDPWGNVLQAQVALTLGPQPTTVTLTNTMAGTAMPGGAGAWTGEARAARELTATDLAALADVPADARVLVSGDGAGGTEVVVLSAWNSIKNVLVAHDAGGAVRIANAVHVGFVGGEAATALNVTGAKRAELATGAGDDVVTVEACANNADGGAAILVSAGAGNDRVTVHGHGAITTGRLEGGAGDDVLVFTGGGGAVLDGGPGADGMEGGSGRDTFILRPGEMQGDVILGFAGAGGQGGDWLVLEGFGAGATLTHQGEGLWRVSYVQGGVAMSESFTIAGVTTLGADDLVWA